LQCVAVPAENVSKVGVADANGLLQHGGEHRLKIAGRTADGLKYFRRCRLLLQRLVPLACEPRDLRHTSRSWTATGHSFGGTAAFRLERRTPSHLGWFTACSGGLFHRLHPHARQRHRSGSKYHRPWGPVVPNAVPRGARLGSHASASFSACRPSEAEPTANHPAASWRVSRPPWKAGYVIDVAAAGSREDASFRSRFLVSRLEQIG
jgi:hypothetical protein